MLVSQLDWPELKFRLSGPGLPIRTGPFINRLRSSLPIVFDGISRLYADFPLAADDDFVEYTVSVNRVHGAAGWLRSQASFLSRGDAYSPFERFSARLGFAFLEWGLNWSIYGRCSPYFILHAAVLERSGRALIILGDSGSGKSTLCAALAFSGWRLLSDELGLVNPVDGMISPLARPVSLKGASIDVIQSFAPDAVISVPQRTPRKGILAHVKPPTDSVRRMDEPAEPAWIVFVKYIPGAPISVADVPKPRAFAELLRSGFNYRNLGDVGFRQCGRLIDRCECRMVEYGRLSDVVTHFDSAVYQSE